MGTVNPRTLFSLLAAAYQYQNSSNYRTLINQALLSNEIFTPNVRADSGQVDTWRDYQQLLSEFGLIYSTRYTERPCLTKLGLMYTDGTIGYSELFSIQSLAYQYPNGHKTDMSPVLKKELRQANINIPASRTELDAGAGVLIKPGVLILQILVELHRQGYSPSLSTRECFLALVPTKRNTDWQEAYARLIGLRQQGTLTLPLNEQRKLRPVQEWFRFLSRSDFVIQTRDSISLSSIAWDEIEQLQSLLDFHSNLAKFWLPPDFRAENLVSWYGYSGNPSIESQCFTPEYFRSQNYLEQNYIIEPEPLDDSDSVFLTGTTTEINLRPFSASIPEIRELETTVDTEAIIQGRRRLREQTRQHQEIIVRLAALLTELSYELLDDPNSVDLLAAKDGFETIFEIKTINRRNFLPRIRLGVGQLAEYRYRRQLQTQSRPNSILVLSNTLKLPAWTTDYFLSDVRIGLLCSTTDSFLALTN